MGHRYEYSLWSPLTDLERDKIKNAIMKRYAKTITTAMITRENKLSLNYDVALSDDELDALNTLVCILDTR